MNIINPSLNLIELAKSKKDLYKSADPFPNIVLHDVINPAFLDLVLSEFPDLSAAKNVQRFNTHNEVKLATKGESLFGVHTKELVHFLNSQPMLEFLQELTGIQETLLPDPYFEGGGYHEIKPGGLLKVHADFNKGRITNLDRRINLLIYLNKDWQESYGGHFELWDTEMQGPKKKILPTFNTMAIFSTTSFSYHGHPDPLTCPPDRSRKSLALYYFSNGRPASEIAEGKEEHDTLFVGRSGVKDDVKDTKTLKAFVIDLIPPVLMRMVQKKR